MPEHIDQPVPVSAAGDGSPKFGRLLIVLVLAVMLIGAITLGAEAYYS
jgi:hypothetical protein